MPPPPAAEVPRPFARRPARLAVFDFDGTLSLVREGWAGIMACQGLDLLREQKLAPGPDEPILHRLEDAVLRLSGKPSIFQMRALADAVADAGGVPGDPNVYLADFLRRLFAVTDGRKAQLASGEARRADWVVRGSHGLLDELRRRGVALVLASGTDLVHVRAEADLLGLTPYFGDHVYAPADNTPTFSKRDVIERAVRDHGVSGAELIGFGDGFAETVEVKRAGGVAVGVASREAGQPGVHPMKRDLLTELGADVIVPDYADPERLVAWLFGEVQ